MITTAGAACGHFFKKQRARETDAREEEVRALPAGLTDVKLCLVACNRLICEHLPSETRVWKGLRGASGSPPGPSGETARSGMRTRRDVFFKRQSPTGRCWKHIDGSSVRTPPVPLWTHPTPVKTAGVAKTTKNNVKAGPNLCALHHK